ncbi:MAG: MCP four helix bundle domain-containing protein [Acidobacteria bacterium]|nr:MCP four helix bundle domain-containing protein [Acidobacteriota bacterium]
MARLARYQSAFAIGSVLTVVSFVGATAYSQWRLSTLDTLSSTMASNAIPSIEYLGRAGVAMQRLRRLIYDGVTIGASPAALKQARDLLQDLDEDIGQYLQITPLAGEDELWTALRGDLDRAEASANDTLQALDRGDRAAAARLLDTRLDPAFDVSSRTMLATMEFDVRTSEQLARDVRTLRRTSVRNIIVLDFLATLVAAATALVAFRAARDHDRLLRSHGALLADRVAELDAFAGRIAHDVLSPLDTVGFGLALASRSADAGARAQLERAQGALQRVKQLVEGLLRFARAAGATEAGARCGVAAVLHSVAADAQPAAQASGVELAVESPDGLEVACSIGVLTSIVQNLVSNAIKYIGNRPVRRVTLRAKGSAGGACIEVEDSGPGIPIELRQRMFSPFVRGSHDGIAGLGLGLATVKRLVEAHGGSVSVRSRIGSGTTFLVALPLAETPSSAGAKAPPA